MLLLKRQNCCLNNYFPVNACPQCTHPPSALPSVELITSTRPCALCVFVCFLCEVLRGRQDLRGRRVTLAHSHQQLMLTCTPHSSSVPRPVGPTKPVAWQSSTNVYALYFCASWAISAKGAVSPSIEKTPDAQIKEWRLFMWQQFKRSVTQGRGDCKQCSSRAVPETEQITAELTVSGNHLDASTLPVRFLQLFFKVLDISMLVAEALCLCVVCDVFVCVCLFVSTLIVRLSCNTQQHL